MSHLTHPIAATQLRSHRAAVLAALLALLATVAVVLALTIGAGSTTDKVASHPVASGPSESHVAAAVGSRVTPPPDESSIASSISGNTPVSGNTPQQWGGHDESRIASSLSSR
jgi:hypothetical protein